MNIVYASDNNFAEMLGVSMVSLFENNKDAAEITVYVFSDKISDENIAKLNQTADGYGRRLVIIDVSDREELRAVSGKILEGRWSSSAFSRLFITSLIKDDIDRILYLDCDMIIVDSLEKLYNENMDGYAVCGIEDCISPENKANIGVGKNSVYINTGVMLINMDYWRSNNLSDEYIGFIKNYKGFIPYVDQGVINAVLTEKIKRVPVRFNAYTVLFDFSYKELIKYRKPVDYYTEEEVMNALENPAIVHFTTSFCSLRPWVNGCKHKYASEWLRYKGLSLWADAPVRNDNRSAKKKIALKIFRILPRKMAVSIAGLLHSKIVPTLRGRK